MQLFWITSGGTVHQVLLPAESAEVVEGIRWGRGDALDTPAYWALRCFGTADPLAGFVSSTGSWLEEIAFCLLGGFGITAELNTAAFEWLKTNGVFDNGQEFSADSLRTLLEEPLKIDNKYYRYRFPNQRSQRLSAMLAKVRGVEFDCMPSTWVMELLRNISGIGPKTAAWIIRNRLDSDDVAILDVHVIRACRRMGLFPERLVLPRDYPPLEQTFLRFARALGVRPAVLDAVMWTDLRAEKRGVRQLAA